MWEWLSILRLRLHALFERRRLDRDLEDELAFHLAQRAAHSDPLTARRSFGNPTHWKETARDMWTFDWLEALGKDLRYAARTLRRSPGFTLVAALTLALGIGANTAIFSVVNAVILRPLPYAAPDRLVELWGNVKRAKVERRGTSFPDYFDWRTQSQSFDGMALHTGDNVTLTGVDEPERIPAEYVAQPYFDLLGVAPQLGRTFRPEEDQVPQRDAVVVLSDGLWKRRFGADPGVLGRVMQLNGRGYTIVGVMAAGFRGVEDSADLWVPLMMALSAQDMAQRGNRGPAVLARLKRGVSAAQAQSEMDAICRNLERSFPATNEGRGVEISPLEKEIFGDIHTPLVVLLVAVGFVLLIACTNVANLMLARSEARQRELAVRVALGAGRARMLHQLITESLLLALAGAAAGLLLARWGVRALMAASPVTFPGYVHPEVDWRVALFTVAVSGVVGLALGLAPAAQLRTGNLFEAFKQASSHAADSRRGLRFRNALVVAEVALAMLLLVGAGLLIRSLQQLAAIRPGYDAAHVLALRVTLPRLAPAASPGADARTVISARDVLTRVARIPSVEQAATASDVPLAGASAIFYTAEGQPPVTAQNIPRAYIHRASPGFFQALHIPFVAGRSFTEQETQGTSNVAIVSEAVVKRFWPGQDPIGKRLKPGDSQSNSPWWTIVGVVNDMKYRGLPNNPTADPDIFVPFSERQRQFALLVRTTLDPAAIAPAVRRVVREADPTTVIYGISTMEKMIAGETARFRFTGWLMGIFAGSALLLALIGIYGVMSYTVARRTQEIGIRVALGAGSGDVLRLVVGRGMLLIAGGLALGIAGALALTRLMKGLLYGITATDLASFALAAALLAAVAVVACLIPATRASRIHPAMALRNE
jgi:predicted permease